MFWIFNDNEQEKCFDSVSETKTIRNNRSELQGRKWEDGMANILRQKKYCLGYSYIYN